MGDVALGADTADFYEGFVQPLLPFPALLFVILAALPLAGLIGFRLGLIERSRHGYDKYPSERIPGGTSLGALLALLGLLLGFSFNSAVNSREARQTALVEEAAAIGSAFLSADLLEADKRTAMQSVILAYGTTRVAMPEDIGSRQDLAAFLQRTRDAQAKVWPTTLQAVAEESSDPTRVFVVGRVLEMLDAHSRRIAAGAKHLPKPATAMIVSAALVALFIIGNRSALQGRPFTWRTLSLAVVLGVVLLVIFDLDRPHEGTMRLNADPLREVISDMDAALAQRR